MKVFSFFFFFIVLNSYSQIDSNGSPTFNKSSRLESIQIDQRILYKNQNLGFRGQTVDSKVIGNYYLFDTWEGNHILKTTDNKQYKLQTLNFNFLSNKFETQLSKDSLVEIFDEKVEYFSVNSSKYKLINNKLLQEMNSGIKVKLYKQYLLIIKDEFFNPMTKVVERASQYVLVNKYLYFDENGKELNLKLKKNDILKFLNNKSDDIKNFVSINKLDYEKEDDVIKILNYYEQL